LAKLYTEAVIKEIDSYAEMLKGVPITSFYIGGGTPTTMLYNGLDKLITKIYKEFDMTCDIHMESHPNHLSKENLKYIKSLGVQNLSIGMEALQDIHLNALNRPYTAKEVKRALERAIAMDFKCLNADMIFDLPSQTYNEVKETGKKLIKMGVDQVAAYPLFRFPYTRMGSHGNVNNFNLSTIFKRKKMIGILENIFYNAGYERSSVWAFTKTGKEKYCSVTVPKYVGLGASGGTYLKDIFYLNTFNVREYIKAINGRNSAIALSIDLSAKLQMAGWLYWRIYETKFTHASFRDRFGVDLNQLFSNYLRFFKGIGFLKDDGENIIFTDKGTYWLHALEDIFSIDYISTLWGTSKQNPWPQTVKL